ncbi:hypothetical protein GCM10009689_05280 [Brevibacterium antiquum]
MDTESALFGGVDEEEAAEGPEGLTAEVGPILLVEDEHFLPGETELMGGNKSREAGPDDDSVVILGATVRAVGAGCF